MAARPPVLLLLKAHNKGYTRKDGKFVAPFDDKRQGAKPAPSAAPKPAKWSALGSIQAKSPKPKTGGPGLFGGFMAPDHAKDVGQAPNPKATGGQGALFGEPSKHKPLPDSAVAHPQRGDKGQTVMVHYPSTPTPPETWADPDAIATFVPGGAVPAVLNGTPLAPWTDVPQTEEEWDFVAGQNEDLEEPGMEVPKGKVPASGVVVLEPDGRVWVVAPTNRFGNTKNTFPKGGREVGLSLQANAIKEAYEESGLQVEIDSFLGDVVRSTSVARYYLARRVGGTPAAMSWESQAVRLVPAAQLAKFLDRGEDKQVAAWLEGLV